MKFTRLYGAQFELHVGVPDMIGPLRSPPVVWASEEGQYRIEVATGMNKMAVGPTPDPHVDHADFILDLDNSIVTSFVLKGLLDALEPILAYPLRSSLTHRHIVFAIHEYLLKLTAQAHEGYDNRYRICAQGVEDYMKGIYANYQD